MTSLQIAAQSLQAITKKMGDNMGVPNRTQPIVDLFKVARNRQQKLKIQW